MDKSNNSIYSEAKGLEALRKGIEMHRQKRTLQMGLGGVVSLKSLWSAICPEKLRKIKGNTAIVKAREAENGVLYLYIEIPFVDGEYEELRVGESDLEEDNVVDIFSIVAIFIDKGNGETIAIYDAKCLDEDNSFNLGEIKSDIIHQCTDIMMDSNHIEMSIRVTYEGGECDKIQFGVIKGNNDITLYIPYSTEGTPYSSKWHIYSESGPWYTIKIVGYRNARPLTHGLILAESLDSKFNILNADGSVLCKDLDFLDYGPNYLICNCRLYWFNKNNNLWEEKVLPFPSYNKQRERVKRNAVCLNKISIDKDNHFYLFDSLMVVEEYEFDAGGGSGDWWPQYEICHKGIIDKNGSWKAEPSEDIINIEHCHTTIIIYKKNEVVMLDSNKTSGELLKDVSTIDKCEIINDKYLLLIKDSLQGIYDAESGSSVIPCCIDSKYTLKPNTIGNGMIGVFAFINKKRGKHTYQEKKYYYLDYQGNVVLEIEDGWVIDSGFKDGKAIISETDTYHGHYYEQTIDIQGNVLKEKHESLSRELEEYHMDDMRNLDRDNWDAMTDGLYGDYPDEGFDGDYESKGY